MEHTDGKETNTWDKYRVTTVEGKQEADRGGARPSAGGKSLWRIQQRMWMRGLQGLICGPFPSVTDTGHC